MEGHRFRDPGSPRGVIESPPSQLRQKRLMAGMTGRKAKQSVVGDTVITRHGDYPARIRPQVDTRRAKKTSERI